VVLGARVDISSDVTVAEGARLVATNSAHNNVVAAARSG
jgi:hypothetical protein